VQAQHPHSPSPPQTPLASNPTAALDLFSVTPTYLLPRHSHFPPVDTALRVTPAYADAPRIGNITIVYTYVAAPALNLSEALGGDGAVRCACAILRDGLLSHGGYEVRENDGNFLAAFGVASNALRFAVAMQLAFDQVRSPLSSGSPFES
jgi:hypothetical protein